MRSYERFVEEGIILLAKSKEAKTPATTKLAPDWTPARDPEGHVKPAGKLWDFIEMIAKSRREGKNRRDGATVSTRVLLLADKVGQELYSKASSASEPPGTTTSRKRGPFSSIQPSSRL